MVAERGRRAGGLTERALQDLAGEPAGSGAPSLRPLRRAGARGALIAGADGTWVDGRSPAGVLRVVRPEHEGKGAMPKYAGNVNANLVGAEHLDRDVAAAAFGHACHETIASHEALDRMLHL